MGNSKRGRGIDQNDIGHRYAYFNGLNRVTITSVLTNTSLVEHGYPLCTEVTLRSVKVDRCPGGSPDDELARQAGRKSNC